MTRFIELKTDSPNIIRSVDERLMSYCRSCSADAGNLYFPCDVI